MNKYKRLTYKEFSIELKELVEFISDRDSKVNSSKVRDILIIKKECKYRLNIIYKQGTKTRVKALDLAQMTQDYKYLKEYVEDNDLYRVNISNKRLIASCVITVLSLANLYYVYFHTGKVLTSNVVFSVLVIIACVISFYRTIKN